MSNAVQNSARPCGCDPAANHVCEWHEKMVRQELAIDLALIDREVQMRDTVPALGLPGRTKIEDVQWQWMPPRIGPTRPQLPTDPAERKTYPIMSGVLRYFPDAIAEVARVSYAGNEQHNPGQPLHWDRSKSMDQEDTLLRHLMEAGGRDTDGQRHSAKAAWRALAALQIEIEAERAAKTEAA